jgi:hypothetical protein
MFVTIPAPLQQRKRDFARACVAGQNAHPELRRGQGPQTRFPELCG